MVRKYLGTLLHFLVLYESSLKYNSAQAKITSITGYYCNYCDVFHLAIPSSTHRIGIILPKYMK